MIVKTGANYQAEGRYIEASREGNEVTIRIEDSAPVIVPDINGKIIDSVEIAQISKDPSFTGSITFNGLSADGDYMSGYSVSSRSAHGLCYNIGSPVIIQGHTPALKEGSKNCVIKHDISTGFYLLFATGSNPVAILGVAE